MSLPYNSQTVQAYQNQINAFNDKIVNGTITESERQQAKVTVGNYYEYLAATGIKYGEAAYDVSQNQNAFGQFANEHLELSAIDQGKDPATVESLKSDFMIKLALGDADARLQTSDGNISYHDIAELHYDILQNDFGLNKTAWGGTFFEEFSGSGSWMDYGGYDHNVDVLQINAFDSLVNNQISNGVSSSNAFQSLLKTKESGNDNLFWDALGNGLVSSRVLNAIYNLTDGLKDFDDNNDNIITNSSDKIKNAFSNFESIFDSSGNVKSSQQDFYNKITGNQLDASKVLVTDNGNIFLLDDSRQMTVKLFGNSDALNSTKINSLASVGKNMGAAKLKIIPQDNDSTYTLPTQYITDEEGNIIFDANGNFIKNPNTEFTNALSQNNGQTIAQKAENWLKEVGSDLSSWLEDAGTGVNHFMSTVATATNEGFDTISNWFSSAFSNGTSDATFNPLQIDNSLLNLEIETDKLKDFAADNNSLGQTGIVIGDADWRATFETINENGVKNVLPGGILSDGYRPGNMELSQYANFNTQLNADFSKLDNLASQLQQNSSGNFTQLNATLSNISNQFSNSLNFLNIDPVVLDMHCAPFLNNLSLSN